MKLAFAVAAVVGVCVVVVDSQRPEGAQKERPTGEPPVRNGTRRGADDSKEDAWRRRGPGGPFRGRFRGRPEGNKTDSDESEENGSDSSEHRRGGPQRDRRGFRAAGHPNLPSYLKSLPDVNTFSWNREISSGVIVEESAHIRNGTDIAVVRSQDPDLVRNNVTKSTTVYDFTNSTALVLIVPWAPWYPCFLITSPLAFNDIVDTLNTRNGTNIPRTSIATLDGNGTPLTPDEVKALTDSNKSIRRFCDHKNITRAAPTPVTPQSADAQQIVVLTLDTEYTVLYNLPPRPAGSFRGPGFKPPGGKGKGGPVPPPTGGPRRQ